MNAPFLLNTLTRPHLISRCNQTELPTDTHAKPLRASSENRLRNAIFLSIEKIYHIFSTKQEAVSVGACQIKPERNILNLLYGSIVEY